MNKKLILSLVLTMAILAVGVYSWTLVTYVPVSSCTESDGGLNFFTAGNITFTFDNNGTNVTLTKFDTCFDNITIGEYACSENAGYPAGYAALVSENCTAINGTSCFMGACV
ncbi:MAG: hypothetical protein Q8Q42_01210 [Nanoarchaeota archaeon]|nr:hypothetical protein [Nanoarchaeota archaeon]